MNGVATLGEQPAMAFDAPACWAGRGDLARTIRIVYVVVAVLALLAGLGAGLAMSRATTKRSTAERHSSERHSTDVVEPLGAPGAAPVSPLAGRVIEALAEGVVVVDRGDNVLLANPAAHALGAFAGSAHDRLGADALRSLAHRAVDSGVVEQLTVQLPKGFLGRESIHVSVAAVPLGHDEIGRVSVVALLLSDMTETRRLEDVRRDFVANVSHELKTPVGALTLLAEAVQDAAGDPTAVHRFAGRMQHEGQRLGRLVGELITLSRVQGAEALPEIKPVQVRRIFAEAIDRTRLAAERVATTVTASCSDGLIVFGDEAQLTTAVTNLTDNAVSYSPDGTRVVLSARLLPADAQGGAFVELAVTDQGIGIAEADRDRIFERFYRVDPARSRATGGTGLGLAIVKHIVTNYGGAVRVWSAEGAGSTFSIRLPGAQVDEAAVLASTKGSS